MLSFLLLLMRLWTSVTSTASRTVMSERGNTCLLLVGLVLSFVTMMSVLSVPLMVAGSQPTLLTVDMAFRINSYGDYRTANALGVISYLITAVAAWFYLKRQMADARKLA